MAGAVEAEKHSLFSASKSPTWIPCPGSLVLSKGVLGTPPTRASATGSVAHLLLERQLQGKDTSEMGVVEQDGFFITVDDKMRESVQVCLDEVEQYRPHADFILSEQRVNYSQFIQVPTDEGWGTADVIIGMGDQLIVIDYKNGFHPVEADTPQNKLYGLGVLAAVDGVAGDYAQITLVIVQPNALGNAVKAYPISKADLLLWAKITAAEASADVLDAFVLHDAGFADADAAIAWEDRFLKPGDEQCKWCPAAPKCPKLKRVADAALKVRMDAIKDDPELAHWMSQTDALETFLKSVRGAVLARLMAGARVGDYKLVRGRKGDAAWTDREAAEAFLKDKVRLKVDERYDKSLISPTTARNLANKGVIPVKKVADLETLIVSPEGGLSVAKGSDKRPAVNPLAKAAADEFEDVTASFV